MGRVKCLSSYSAFRPSGAAPKLSQQGHFQAHPIVAHPGALGEPEQYRLKGLVGFSESLRFSRLRVRGEGQALGEEHRGSPPEFQWEQVRGSGGPEMPIVRSGAKEF